MAGWARPKRRTQEEEDENSGILAQGVPYLAQEMANSAIAGLEGLWEGGPDLEDYHKAETLGELWDVATTFDADRAASTVTSRMADPLLQIFDPPTAKGGQALLNNVAALEAPVEDAVQWGADRVYDVTQSPAAAASTLALGSIVPLPGRGRGGRASPDEPIRAGVDPGPGLLEEMNAEKPPNQPGFYSRLERDLDTAQNKQSPQQWAKWAEKNGHNMEAGERGLTDWLANQEGTVSKDQVAGFLETEGQLAPARDILADAGAGQKNPRDYINQHITFDEANDNGDLNVVGGDGSSIGDLALDINENSGGIFSFKGNVGGVPVEGLPMSQIPYGEPGWDVELRGALANELGGNSAIRRPDFGIAPLAGTRPYQPPQPVAPVPVDTAQAERAQRAELARQIPTAGVNDFTDAGYQEIPGYYDGIDQARAAFQSPSGNVIARTGLSEDHGTGHDYFAARSNEALDIAAAQRLDVSPWLYFEFGEGPEGQPGITVFEAYQDGETEIDDFIHTPEGFNPETDMPGEVDQYMNVVNSRAPATPAPEPLTELQTIRQQQFPGIVENPPSEYYTSAEHATWQLNPVPHRPGFTQSTVRESINDGVVQIIGMPDGTTRAIEIDYDEPHLSITDAETGEAINDYRMQEVMPEAWDMGAPPSRGAVEEFFDDEVTSWLQTWSVQHIQDYRANPPGGEGVPTAPEIQQILDDNTTPFNQAGDPIQTPNGTEFRIMPETEIELPDEGLVDVPVQNIAFEVDGQPVRLEVVYPMEMNDGDDNYYVYPRVNEYDINDDYVDGYPAIEYGVDEAGRHTDPEWRLDEHDLGAIVEQSHDSFIQSMDAEALLPPGTTQGQAPTTWRDPDTQTQYDLTPRDDWPGFTSSGVHEIGHHDVMDMVGLPNGRTQYIQLIDVNMDEPMIHTMNMQGEDVSYLLSDAQPTLFEADSPGRDTLLEAFELEISEIIEGWNNALGLAPANDPALAPDTGFFTIPGTEATGEFEIYPSGHRVSEDVRVLDQMGMDELGDLVAIQPDGTVLGYGYFDPGEHGLEGPPMINRRRFYEITDPEDAGVVEGWDSDIENTWELDEGEDPEFDRIAAVRERLVDDLRLDPNNQALASPQPVSPHSRAPTRAPVEWDQPTVARSPNHQHRGHSTGVVDSYGERVVIQPGDLYAADQSHMSSPRDPETGQQLNEGMLSMSREGWGSDVDGGRAWLMDEVQSPRHKRGAKEKWWDEPNSPVVQHMLNMQGPLRPDDLDQSDQGILRSAMSAVENRVPPTPMRKGAKWVEHQMARGLSDAVGRNADHFTWNTAETMNNRWHTQGALFDKIYDKVMPKARLWKQLGVKPERVQTSRGSEVWGVKLTPELKSRLVREGIPYYVVGGMAILGGAASGDSEEDQGMLNPGS